jgi:hypothetical protein
MSATPPPAVRTTTVAPQPRRNTLLIVGLVVLIVFLVVRSCASYESGLEKTVRVFNQAIQRDDMAEVQKLENSGTAADMSAAALGHASDTLAPLGDVRHVKEKTPSDDPPRVHEFDVTFAKGTAHEKIELDPQGKIFHFRYDPPQRST